MMTALHRFRARGLVAVAGLLSLFFLGFAAPAARAAATVTVDIVNFDFVNAQGVHTDPTIHVGDTIEWVWQSGFHSTTSVAGLAEDWDSGTRSAGGATLPFDHTFTHAGTFAYYCTIHGFDNGNQTAGGMSGQITVLPAAAPEPSSWAGLGLGFLGLAGLAVRVRRCRVA